MPEISDIPFHSINGLDKGLPEFSHKVFITTFT